jgi:hypothetical protein
MNVHPLLRHPCKDKTHRIGAIWLDAQASCRRAPSSRSRINTKAVSVRLICEAVANR